MNMQQTSKDKPLISVVMPAYNAEKYIGEAIQSVFQQTYDNWELVVIDDGSTDRTLYIAKQHASRDTRIHVYQNKKNLGVARTRNRGFALATGEWVALLDSDDIWNSNKLERQLEVAECTKCDIVYCSYSLFEDLSGKRTEYIVPEKISYKRMLIDNVFSCSTIFVSKDIVKKHNFSTEFYHEDYALWLQLIREGYYARGCSEILANYRLSSGSRSADKLKCAKYRWDIYRRAEKLPVFISAISLMGYAIRGTIKYIAICSKNRVG